MESTSHTSRHFTRSRRRESCHSDLGHTDTSTQHTRGVVSSIRVATTRRSFTWETLKQVIVSHFFLLNVEKKVKARSKHESFDHGLQHSPWLATDARTGIHAIVGAHRRAGGWVQKGQYRIINLHALNVDARISRTRSQSQSHTHTHTHTHLHSHSHTNTHTWHKPYVPIVLPCARPSCLTLPYYTTNGVRVANNRCSSTLTRMTAAALMQRRSSHKHALSVSRSARQLTSHDDGSPLSRPF